MKEKLFLAMIFIIVAAAAYIASALALETWNFFYFPGEAKTSLLAYYAVLIIFLLIARKIDKY